MQGNAGIINFIPLLVIFGIFYFLIIKPQQKKQKEHQEMVTNLKKNDEVVTVGGVHGTVIQVKDKTLNLRIDENTKIEIDKVSIAYLKKVR
ncbi:MAG: preprotein translocase subunit YajC [Candidatus Omnitrophica bacterium]|nr:preprotein translocase subunit YajC [Candidatus Omnitrophota bacterium]MBU2045068.1 preprotein translocase subunit YajC [Candidatus Omnitrophota bacterium]MBU2251105.1 preprotein translocase subunit YajC [Candidatus Omnitrophota bacterium]MBU2266355.1 preprotein translocase subunit YajC [Candidatus Omnitrophota bacterium]MBU2473195.1 preprotein translocase subunit YajC [Candidatus Omnitrophota bacterium]